MSTFEKVTFLDGTSRMCVINYENNVFNTPTEMYYNTVFINNHNVLVKSVQGERFECDIEEILSIIE